MSWDIYGNPLRRGCCEVHPNVHEEYPCSICMAERNHPQINRHTHEEFERLQYEFAHQVDYIRHLESERAALAAQVEGLRKALAALSVQAESALQEDIICYSALKRAQREADEVLDKAPQHHLCQVRADAVTEAADKMGDAFILPANLRRETNKAEFYKAGWRDAFLFLKQYAASIRQEVE